MTRWQPLPESMPREARHLVEQLRVLKGRTGLSLAELARRTAYSKSSWQRYLSGAKLPPRGAAQVLGPLAGADQQRLLALWELAEQTWPQGASQPEAEPQLQPGHQPQPPPEPRGLAYRRWRTAALVAFAAVVLLAAGLLWRCPGARATVRPPAPGP